MSVELKNKPIYTELTEEIIQELLKDYANPMDFCLNKESMIEMDNAIRSKSKIFINEE